MRLLAAWGQRACGRLRSDLALPRRRAAAMMSAAYAPIGKTGEPLSVADAESFVGRCNEADAGAVALEWSGCAQVTYTGGTLNADEVFDQDDLATLVVAILGKGACSEQITSSIDELYRAIALTEDAHMPAIEHNRFVRAFVDLFGTPVGPGIEDVGSGGHADETLFEEVCAMLKRIWAH